MSLIGHEPGPVGVVLADCVAVLTHEHMFASASNWTTGIWIAVRLDPIRQERPRLDEFLTVKEVAAVLKLNEQTTKLRRRCHEISTGTGCG